MYEVFEGVKVYRQRMLDGGVHVTVKVERVRERERERERG